ncbi:glycosyltransferase [uncultured Hymenobacter sp.]|uniref:glycosyltransferase n=1 Tax=uncultured Hymenobacter sp. TaxID=170016 RepID=UPI0035C9CC41
MLESPARPGVTILICTYNGAARLPETLRHVAEQQAPAGLAWEVLLVSNASTDDTLAAASPLWTELGAPAPLRVLNEPRSGKENALTRGFDEAGHEYVCIVDDDNWLYPDYLGQVEAVMDAHPEIGILGACAEAEFEVAPPAWFEQFRAVFAVGPQAPQPGPLREPGAYLYGAGSVVRRAAWRHLRAHDFAFTTSTKRGKIIVSGEDVELGDAMRLAGYALWYDPRLRLRHFMFRERLTWEYLLRIGQGTALSSLHSTVSYFLQREPTLDAAGFRRRYYRWLAWALRQLMNPPGRLVEYRRHLHDPAHPAAFETMRLLYRLRAGWSRRREAFRIFAHAKALQVRLQAHPAPIALPPAP